MSSIFHFISALFPKALATFATSYLFTFTFLPSFLLTFSQLPILFCSSGSSFWDWRKRLGEQLNNALDAFERQWQLQLLTSALQDAESHHWADHKEFYEDERCSFGLQFWRLNLERLWQRLSRSCAADLARAALRRLLLVSGRSLRQRYLNARPTPRRMRQFR